MLGTRGDPVFTEEVTKGNTQKADNAAIPDHLWLRVFVLGYGAGGGVARHLKALTMGEGNCGHLDLPGPLDG